MSKSKLGELFLTVAEEELMIERQRQQLASLREFEPYAAFTRVDRDHKGYITAKDIALFVRSNGGRQMYESECNYMIKFFDSEATGRIVYYE